MSYNNYMKNQQGLPRRQAGQVILILILVALVFIGSGGLSILGIQNINFSEGNILPIGVIVLVLLAVLFLYSEKSGDEGEE